MVEKQHGGIFQLTFEKIVRLPLRTILNPKSPEADRFTIGEVRAISAVLTLEPITPNLLNHMLKMPRVKQEELSAIVKIWNRTVEAGPGMANLLSGNTVADLAHQLSWKDQDTYSEKKYNQLVSAGNALSAIQTHQREAKAQEVY